MHDSTVAEWGGVHETLGSMYDAYGGQCMVDSAFRKTHYPFLLKSAQYCGLGSDGTNQGIATMRQAT